MAKPKSDDGMIVFLATIPDVKSAFQADQDTIRVTLELPSQYRAQGLKLADMFGKVLEVAVKEH